MEMEFTTIPHEEGEGRVAYLWHWCAPSGERSSTGFRFFSECLDDARSRGFADEDAQQREPLKPGLGAPGASH